MLHEFRSKERHTGRLHPSILDAVLGTRNGTWFGTILGRYQVLSGFGGRLGKFVGRNGPANALEDVDGVFLKRNYSRNQVKSRK